MPILDLMLQRHWTIHGYNKKIYIVEHVKANNLKDLK